MLNFGSALSKACGDRNAWIYLSGDLGMGKTTLVRGFLQSLGYKERVKSPTYALVESYEVEGKIIFHFDFYRIDQPLDLMQLGLEEYFTDATICLVEWPDRFMSVLPTPDIRISIIREFQKNETPVGNRPLSKLDILFECKAGERPEAQFTLGVNEHRKRERNAAIEQKITFRKRSNKTEQLDTNPEFFGSTRQLNIQSQTPRGDAIMESLYV